jgi:aminotransferase/cystathionine beta-lyase
MINLFDQVIDRTHSQSIRWDKYGPDVIPLWVADMDFQSPECVVQALRRRIDDGVYGYTYASESLKESIQEYVHRRYSWHIETTWIHFLPSLVTALHLSVRMLTQPGDHVLIPGPAYHHFQDSVIGAGRDYSIYNIHPQNGRATFSLTQLESLVKPNTRLLMLCNPHNPGGTVFTKEELSQLAEFANKHQLIICSDEIHADLILDEGLQHIPMGSIGGGVEERSFSLMSLNKTFNFPGLGLAWVICPNPQLSQQLLKDLHTLIPNPNLLSYVATQAAIEHGQEWHQALIQHLRANRDYVHRRIDTIPGLSMHHLQATYLAWIDATERHWENPFEQFLKAGVALSPGSQFGDNQFVRLNFGTQRTLLEKALDRIELACHS